MLTGAGRPRRSTCPGTENRLPGGEPFSKQLFHYRCPNNRQKTIVAGANPREKQSLVVKKEYRELASLSSKEYSRRARSTMTAYLGLAPGGEMWFALFDKIAVLGRALFSLRVALCTTTLSSSYNSPQPSRRTKVSEEIQTDLL